ncbi:hypothetical protein [Streptomyces cadmiisoli]|uniref:Uncharacterized protein n=1 Tax=Streptomyces cadmiisoli TaxID=2184053 RepID=A0A2Z4ITJ2_9ACTN|nr:hypothetical protein [Streptomyces cadmiisoli]AWW36165.1 hypothetical protein DN051_05560 [Streptomyces cadmiisoli]
MPPAPPAPQPEESEDGDVWGDPAFDLIHAAVSDRPLDEVVRLVTLMEESPEHAQTVAAVLRAVAVNRPVDDVALLVAELTRPPRGADSADETIRAAIEGRCVEDVTRLMELLHRTPLQPHCGQEAVRAAATVRPVEELMELIGQLALEQRLHPRRIRTARPTGSTALAEADPSAAPAPGSEALYQAGSEVPPAGRRRRTLRVRREQPPALPRKPVFWPSWLAAATLVVCGAAHFPLHREGAPLTVYAAALGASGLCVLLAVVLVLRSSVTTLGAGMLLPAALAGAELLENRIRSSGLTRALDITVAPHWSAGLTSVCASLASLAALLLLLMMQMALRHPAPRPMAEVGRVAD